MNNFNEKEFMEWAKPLIYDENGKLSEKQILNELRDFYALTDIISKLVYELSMGKLSKPNYETNVLIQELEENYFPKKSIIGNIKEILAMNEFSDSEKLKSIKILFGINNK